VVIHPAKDFVPRVKPEDAFGHLSGDGPEGKVIENLLYEHPTTGEKIASEEDVPFYKKQMRIVFGNNGSIDPTASKITWRGGYQALAKALFSMKPSRSSPR